MGTTVLIVDDHASFRQSARLLLEAEGFEVIGEAQDGESAVEQTSALSPDFVLLDVQLPDTDGFAVANRLTRASDHPTVILTSSREREDFGQLIERCGARGFVGKADLSGDSLRALLGP